MLRCLAATLPCSTAASAQPALQGAPVSPVSPVLAVTGRVARPNRGQDFVFDMAMLEALAQRSFSARTPWYPQARKFTGPLLRTVLEAATAQGTLVRATALNDYRIDIPMSDLQQYDVLLARLLDDKPMAVRDKGPLFIVYPFDERPELRNTLHYSRCAWQLIKLEVL